jgi:adenylate kinase family enzyme
MEAYQRSTRPLIQFYSGLGLLLPVAATSTPQEIYGRTMTALAAHV